MYKLILYKYILKTHFVIYKMIDRVGDFVPFYT